MDNTVNSFALWQRRAGQWILFNCSRNNQRDIVASVFQVTELYFMVNFILWGRHGHLGIRGHQEMAGFGQIQIRKAWILQLIVLHFGKDEQVNGSYLIALGTATALLFYSTLIFLWPSSSFTLLFLVTDGRSEGARVAIGVAERQVRLLDRLDR